MPAAQTKVTKFPDLVFGFIGEAVAGNHTLTGIRPEDALISVVGVKLTLGEAAPNTVAFTFVDLTSEFTISADNTLNNTGGTSLADTFCIVCYHNVPEELDP